MLQWIYFVVKNVGALVEGRGCFCMLQGDKVIFGLLRTCVSGLGAGI